MQSTIERQVMAGVGVVYAARIIFGATALKLYALAGALFAIGQFVFVAKVLENFSQVGFAGAGHFLTAAFLNTDFAVQVMLVVFAVAALSLARDLLRQLATSSPRLVA